MAPEQAAHLIDRAIRIAKVSRSVTCIIVPDDVAGQTAVKTWDTADES